MCNIIRKESQQRQKYADKRNLLAGQCHVRIVGAVQNSAAQIHAGFLDSDISCSFNGRYICVLFSKLSNQKVAQDDDCQKPSLHGDYHKNNKNMIVDQFSILFAIYMYIAKA